MPFDDRLRFDHDQSGSPVRPEPGQPDPEDPVVVAQFWAFNRPLQNQHLLTQGHIFGDQVGSMSKDTVNEET